MSSSNVRKMYVVPAEFMDSFLRKSKIEENPIIKREIDVMREKEQLLKSKKKRPFTVKSGLDPNDETVMLYGDLAFKETVLDQQRKMATPIATTEKPFAPVVALPVAATPQIHMTPQIGVTPQIGITPQIGVTPQTPRVGVTPHTGINPQIGVTPQIHVGATPQSAAAILASMKRKKKTLFEQAEEEEAEEEEEEEEDEFEDVAQSPQAGTSQSPNLLENFYAFEPKTLSTKAIEEILQKPKKKQSKVSKTKEAKLAKEKLRRKELLNKLIKQEASERKKKSEEEEMRKSTRTRRTPPRFPLLDL